MAARRRIKRGDHLVLRGNTYTYRRQIPEPLRDVLGHEIVRSLRTSDVVVARTRSTRINLEVDLLLEAAEDGAFGAMQAARGAVDAVIAKYQREEVLADRDKRNRLRDADAGEGDWDEVNVPELLHERHMDGWLPVEETLAAIKTSGLKLSAAQVGDLLAAMQRHGVVAARMGVEADRHREQRFEPVPSVAPVSGEGAGEVPVSPPVGELVERFVADKVATRVWTERVAYDNASAFKGFLTFVGADTPASAVSREVARKWRDDSLKTLAVTTVRTRVKLATTLYNWLAAEGLVVDNPFKGLAPKPPTKRSGETRVAYTREDLGKLFGPELTKRRTKRPDQFWLPLLALYSGARVTELAQLTPEDVLVKDGVEVIEIRVTRPKAQRLKNDASERTIPLHSHLVGLDFMAYAASRKGEDWLFADVAAGPKGRGMGSRMVSHWPRWCQKFRKLTPRTSFHSLRHGVAQALVAANVEEVVVKQLLGHADASMTTGTYGRRLDVKQLQRGIEHLGFSDCVHALRSVE